jgi:tRNA A37 N6-isopentenylltransferase MiaA
MNGIGYRQTVDWLKVESSKLKVGEPYKPYNFTNLINSITLASVQYAKRQRTRFRRYKKDSLENPKDRVIYIDINLSK